MRHAGPQLDRSSSWKTLFAEVAGRYSGAEVDRRWRLDLLDAYAYMRTCDRRGFQSKESVVNGLLNRYPLSEDGYIALAANLFWNNWPTLTQMFMRINNFLDQHLQRRATIRRS